MSSSSNFDKAMDFVFKWEGGLCDDANDAGGITKYGVCLRFLKSIRPSATRQDIINLTKEQAKDIFYTEFWLKCHCDELSDNLAFALFDTAINVGVCQAVKFLQRCLGVKDDGKIGVITLQAIQEYPNGEDGLIICFLKKRKQFYQDLATKKQSQKVFLNGWLNRTHSLWCALLQVDDDGTGAGAVA